jgi:hypothetical protein
MKLGSSPILTAAISATFALAAFGTSALAQSSTSVTEQTVTQTTTTTQPKAINSTEIDFLPASAASDINVRMLRDFQNVKAGDPNVGPAIAKDPARVQDAAFVGKHPSLQAFLEKYPDARQQIVSNPGNFVTPVAGSKWNSHEAAGIPRD